MFPVMPCSSIQLQKANAPCGAQAATTWPAERQCSPAPPLNLEPLLCCPLFHFLPAEGRGTVRVRSSPPISSVPVSRLHLIPKEPLILSLGVSCRLQGSGAPCRVSGPQTSVLKNVLGMQRPYADLMLWTWLWIRQVRRSWGVRGSLKSQI